jgi:tetratricopeptide (TPR) repeat protein
MGVGELSFGGGAEAFASGLEHLKAGRFREAFVELGVAADLCPGLPGCIAAFARACVRLGMYGEAVAATGRAGGASLDDYALWVVRGDALRGVGRAAEAARSYERALEFEPSCVEARIGLGAALLSLGRREECCEQYMLAAELSPGSDEAHFRRGLACEWSGDVLAALASYKTACALNPFHARACYYGGMAAEELGLLSEAVSLYMNALEADGAFAEVLCRLPSLREAAGSSLSYGHALWLNSRLSFPPFVEVVSG